MLQRVHAHSTLCLLLRHSAGLMQAAECTHPAGLLNTGQAFKVAFRQ